MKKLLLVTALAAISLQSNAVHLSPNMGQVLIGPYYTVQGGQETLVSIVNTKDETKAIKVRFLEAVNSRDVLDFNLYMSPFDVWTAKLLDDPVTGGVRILTRDTSCTVPTIPAQGEPFRKIAYDGSYPEFPIDGGDTSYSRLREGHIEIIEMGIADVGYLGAWDRNMDGSPDSTHVDGIPERCLTFSENWITPSGDWRDYDNDTLPPTGGLFGSAAVIHVQEGYEFGVPFTVLADFSDRNLHVHPGTLSPDLRDAFPPISEVRGDDGIVYADLWPLGIDAVSATLMANRIFSEFSVNLNVEAETSWVISFPTKHEHVDLDVTHTPPFASKFEDGKSCDRVSDIVWNREEDFEQGDGFDFSPMPPTKTAILCYETNVINFNGGSAIYANETAIQFETDYSNGWGMVGFGEYVNVMSAQNTYYGLPVIGFRATKLGNSNVGIGASYAVSDEFKYSRRIESGSGS